MDANSQIMALVNKSHLRYFLQTMLDQCSVAVTVAMGATVLLLLLGTQILDWYWPLVLFVGSLAIGLYRFLRRRRSHYELLQQVDARLSLRDSLSTAYYFSELAGDHPVAAESVEAQRSEAEGLSRTLDPRSAVPFSMPRSVYMSVVAVVAAGSLFALRYGVRQSLDLKPPISQALIEFFRPTEEMARAWEQQKPDPASPEDPDLTAENAPRREGQIDPDAETKLTAVESAEATGEAMTPDSNRPADEGVTPLDNQDENGGQQGEPADADDGSELPPDMEAVPPPDSDGENEPPLPQAEENDLIKKMQDAFAKMMAKLKIPPRAGEGRRTTSKNGQARKKQMPGAGDEEMSMPQGEGMPTQSPQGQESQQMAQQASAGKGEGPPQKSSQPGEESSRSGMGSKDGAKDVKLAQQLEAMGKLSEILGKRAENIKGEVMVEVSSGNQRLRTEYSESSATHAAAGSEIHRDEVPLVFQEYVQRYFEAVHTESAGEQNSQ